MYYVKHAYLFDLITKEASNNQPQYVFHYFRSVKTLLQWPSLTEIKRKLIKKHMNQNVNAIKNTRKINNNNNKEATQIIER